ncbi:ATP-binding protein [candidate division CSSED10-310 bacterium]|uniref:histidine kinase n=1 Tax=candidate division CSSED10-310 bacterium TaxID=2855610 RepID=A0ABV6YR91_UNCC1
MNLKNKTKKQLAAEIASLQQRIAQLEKSQALRKQTEREMNRLNRALQTLSASNKALIRAVDDIELLREICRIIVEKGKYRLAWVGVALTDEVKSVKPLAQAGFEDGYLDSIKISWADDELGAGPTGTAIRIGEPCIARDILNDPSYSPWREAALKRGYASSIALPISLDNKPIGALNIYAEEPDAFDAVEVELLTELADDLGYGISVIRDRTEREKAEEEKRHMQAQLLQAQKMEAIGILTGGIAHDFNNLLTTIRGNTELALLKLTKKDASRKYLRRVTEASALAADLTRQLLIFSRRRPARFSSINIINIIENLVKMITRIIGEDIVIRIKKKDDLWLMNAHAGHLEQVIMNLMVNARDAMPQGGTITIKTDNVIVDEKRALSMPEARPGNFVCISFSDTGSGMDEATMQHIFEPFFTTRQAAGGTGLGLSVVYGIVRQHKGWISVASKPGAGTTFQIFFPATFSEEDEREHPSISRESLQGHGEKILLVEDETAVQQLATEMLQANGYVVSATRSADEAVEVFDEQQGAFQLVLSDMVMPGESGLMLVDKLLLQNPDLKIILSSGYIDDKAKLETILERGYQFLQKPYSLTDLLRIVHDTLSA